MNKKVVYPILVLAAGLGIAMLLVKTSPKLESVTVERHPPAVRVVQVSARAEYLSITSQGTVQPRTQSELIPEVSGQVVWMSPSLVGGGAFKGGEPLLRIQDDDYRTAVARSQAMLERAQVEEEFSGVELDRLDKLFVKNLASQSQLDSAQRASRVAEANLLEARAALDQAERDLSRTEIKAPFDGLVRSEHVDPGQFVSRGNSIATLYATDYVEVRLPIAAAQLRFLGVPTSAQGQFPEELRPEVTLSADFGDTRVFWQGKLVRTEAVIDERSRMIFGVTRLPYKTDAAGPVIPVGLFVQADIRGIRMDNLIRLPRSAIRDREQVLVVDAENRLNFREVSVLRMEGEEVLIDAGLADGELVCISPLQTVVQGMSVAPVTE
jgi:RND family efflux transporter MFP subunit